MLERRRARVLELVARPFPQEAATGERRGRGWGGEGYRGKGAEGVEEAGKRMVEGEARVFWN